MLTRWHVESNGATMTAPGVIGSPQRADDDVIVDGPFVTAQDFRAAPELGRRLARLVLDELAPVPVVPQQRRVLLVIANRDFWWREYAEPREELEARGIEVEVAAGTSATCLPHAGSGAPDGLGAVEPDLTIAEALQDPTRWDAVAVVGGWGASAYQPTYDGTYADPAYNGDAALRRDVGDLLVAMRDAGRWVTALCHGVSVLAYAEDGGQGLIAGRTVVAWPHWAPAEVADDGTTFQRLTREHVEASGAVMLPAHSVGDPLSPFDDVVVDGPFITGESFDSAREFGRVLAGRVLEGPPAP